LVQDIASYCCANNIFNFIPDLIVDALVAYGCLQQSHKILSALYIGSTKHLPNVTNTFKQARDLGGSVRRGEHGSKVYFVKQLQVRDEHPGGEDSVRLVPMLREYVVFNVDQCEGLPGTAHESPRVRVRNPEQRSEVADDFLRCTGADIREGHGDALYIPSRDFISLPAFEAFRGADQFYCTVFHELGHWSGHPSRVARDLKNRFGSRKYAAEELVAELCAAFLCAEFGFDGDLRHAGYIATWIELLKQDKRALFTAASKASQAAEYLRRLAIEAA
jgi:antirestriction protein ArdC